MIEDELIQIWQSSPEHERIKFEKSKLMLEVQSSLNKFQKITKFWDFGTIISAASMILVFAYQAYRQPNLLLKFGVILIVVWCLFLIYIVIKLKKTKPHEANNYREYLEQNKQYLENQISISNKFMSLTILPCFSGVALIMVGKLNLINKSWSEIVNINMVWIGFLIFIVVGVFSCQLNKWVMKKELLPRLQKVNELLELLEEEE